MSTTSIVCMAAAGLTALALPIVLFLALRRKCSLQIAPVLIGAASFVVFALVLESGVHQLIMARPFFHEFIATRWWAYSLYGGLMAGLFEESGRLICFYFLLRRRSHLGSALSYGIGHGGIEAILLCTLTMGRNIYISVILNTAGVEGLTAMFGAEVAELLASQLTTMPAAVFLVSGLERIIAFAFHVAASVLVWMAASGRGPWGLFFLAILLHLVLDFPAGMFQAGVLTNLWLVEGLVALISLAVCLLTASIYRVCSRSYTPLLDYRPNRFG